MRRILASSFKRLRTSATETSKWRYPMRNGSRTSRRSRSRLAGAPLAHHRLLRRNAVSWTIGTGPDAELVNAMLDAARSPQDDSENNRSARGPLRPRRPLPLAGLAIKNERQKHLRSMSRKACSPDSVACEGSFGRLKNELLHPRDRQTATIEQFVEAVDSYIRWYDEKRIKMSPRSPTIPGEPWTCDLNQSKYLSASTAGQDSMEIDKLRLWPNSCGGGALPAWPDCHRSTYCTTDALAREWCPGTKGCRLAPRRL